MSNPGDSAPRTILGDEDVAVAVLKPAEQQGQVPTPQAPEPTKPTTLQIWIGSAGYALWMWWMGIGWALVITYTIGGYFEAPFWGWLAFALLGVGFRFVLEAWGAQVQGITEDDYDPSKYPWWGRKIRLSRRGRP